ncbi:MAG: HAD hydrolase-like protein [Chloroflexota bacterium]
MIKTIFFDFDGVLTTDKSGSYTTCKYLQSLTPHISFEHVLSCYRDHHSEMLVGRTTHRDTWQTFCDCVGVNWELGLLDEAFRQTPGNKKVFQLCKVLQPSYSLGIITDNSSERFKAIKDEMKLADLFDYFVVSGDIGTRKDNEANFNYALDLARAKPEECIFIDNNRDNLVVPAKMGFRTIFHDDAQNDVARLVEKMERFGAAIDYVVNS